MRRIYEVRGPLPGGFAALEMEATAAGFAMLRSLRGEWPDGFAGDRAALFAAEDAGRLVGVGGIAPDPYLDDPVQGRLRHFYVPRAGRRSGVGSDLLAACLAFARGPFARVGLRTPGTDEAAAFYEKHGFLPVSAGTLTHRLVLN